MNSRLMKFHKVIDAAVDSGHDMTTIKGTRQSDRPIAFPLDVPDAECDSTA